MFKASEVCEKCGEYLNEFGYCAECAKDPCYVCGNDMAKDGVGMFERKDGEYQCESCYTGACDRAYDRYKEEMYDH